MTLLPVTVPASLIRRHGLDPEAHDWGMKAEHAVATPDGDTYVLSILWRHHPYPRDPALPGFSERTITRYAPDGTPVATAVLDREAHGRVPTVGWGSDANLAVLPDGSLVVSTRPGSTHLLSPGLDEVRAGWSMPAGDWRADGPAGDPFAASVAVTPGGRLLCMTAEHKVNNWAGAILNLIAVTEPGDILAPGHKPQLRAIATLDPQTPRQTEADAYPHVRYGDAPVAGANRPSPSLTEALTELTGTHRSLHGYDRSFMSRPSALGDDLFVVPVFGHTFRSGSRGQEFSFTLLDDRGAVRGRLGGLHLYDDSPFTGFDFTVAADPYRARAFHLNRYGLYAWTADGALRARLSTADKPFKPLVHHTLLDCTPAGELLLAHRKQHTVLRVPSPPTSPTSPPPSRPPSPAWPAPATPSRSATPPPTGSGRTRPPPSTNCDPTPRQGRA
ncbi:hypothetical protein [Kitasatospora cheerisanensis]|uniref:Uncharacterized protein n=1 Tax=Kitasatospora cheerisanensis KCTC 2395 TaxID=1348663 RepID=A0A066Z3J4_9ACTN|nr:hypothetical protein [Kitasatospora cheerisanensis]KDN84705.1 hypothetical protein KCH_35700 [Kitasatospora cheerisanensis KCTC 2395]